MVFLVISQCFPWLQKETVNSQSGQESFEEKRLSFTTDILWGLNYFP